MTQLSGIESEQGEWTRAGCTQTTNAEPMLSASAASNSGSPAPRPSAWWDESQIQPIARTGTALLFAGLAPALVMAARWHTAEIGPFTFTFTFAIALGHAILLGLPLFLVFRSVSWINVTTCIMLGFVVGAAPVGVLTWPMQYPELHTGASVVGVPMIISNAIRTIGWTDYIKPLIYFGSFGAFSGFAFWAALTWSGTFESDFFNPSLTRSPRNNGDDNWKCR
jgi:hypothetical protein